MITLIVDIAPSSKCVGGVELVALPPPRIQILVLPASALTVVAGIAGLAVVLLDREVALATSVLGQPLPDWFFASPGKVWLVLQAVLVIVGVVGGLMLQRFSLMVIGILAGLVFVTPVGLLTMIPAVCLLVLVLLLRKILLLGCGAVTTRGL